MNMIEKVAEALSRLPVRDFSQPGGELDQLRLREAARAAIGAMRELTPEMTDLHPPFVQKNEFLESYRAMIDSALNGGNA